MFAIEEHKTKSEVLKTRLSAADCTNTHHIASDFLCIDPRDERFANVKAVIIEPPNTGTGIVDKMGYLLQEEGVNL